MIQKLDTEKFISKAKSVHGSKYNYTLVDYVNSRTKVVIICPIHGEFEQRPALHLFGQSCPLCSMKAQSSKRCLTVDKFIEKAINKHGNKYDYSLVEYTGNKSKVKLICLTHGKFEQIPNAHLLGQGCPKCGIKSKGELKIRELLERRNLEFDEQKSFNGCNLSRNGDKLRFDFYLPNLKTAIEYDGIGHYEPTTFGGCSKEKAKENLRKQKKRDSIKTQFCLENGINLIRIPYWEKNIDLALNKYLITGEAKNVV